MSAATQLYLATLGTYICVNVIASWALDIQFGVTGVLNFCFIIFQSAGAYTAAVLSLGPSSTSGGFQQYILGWHLPFPLPIIGAMVVGGALAGLVGLISLRRLRSDYQAIVMFVVSVIATTVVSAQIGFLNGPAGISLVKNPMESLIHATRQTQIWVFVLFCLACAIVVGVIMYALVYSPYGRVLRAVRENDRAIEALGRNATRYRMEVFILGGALAGLSGALLIEFIGAWAPNGWFYPETFVFFTAVIVGGRGSLLGVAVGASLICVGVQQAVEYLPITLNPSVISSLEWVITGLLTLTFLWMRPQGIFPNEDDGFPYLGVPRPSWITTRTSHQRQESSMSDLDRPLAPEPLLVVEDVARSFGGVRAVDGVSFSVPRGSITGLIGPNGAGKSSVLGMIAGAIRPDRGRILLDGEDIAGRHTYQVARRGVIRTFQSASVFPHLTVLENLILGVPTSGAESIPASFFSRRRWKRAETEHVAAAREILERLRLSAHGDTYASELSGGQKRLVEIGRVIMAKPRLLLLDEPMAGVNRTLAAPIEELIGNLRHDGMTVVLIEHELGLIDRLCSPVVVLAQGKVLMQGEMEELRMDPEVRRAYLVG